MAAIAPPPGALYNAPPLPGEFGVDPVVVAAATTPAALATCYAVTTGPDRNLYWVYGHMPMTATGIPVAAVTPGCCFETLQSIALSQGKVRPRQICTTCGYTLSRHMTTVQAATAFAAHVAAFPATHVTLNAPIAVGVAAPPGYASVNGITAPIPAAVVVPLAGPAAAPPVAAPALPVPPAPAAPVPVPVIAPAAMPPPIPLVVPVAPPASVGADTPSLPAPTAQYKLLTEMVKINSQSVWSDDQEAHRFMTGLESILEFSPVLHSHWTSLIIMMIPGKYELERTWVRSNIMIPLISWNAAKATFINHFQRGDYLDGRRLLYSQCHQSQEETIQEYTRRFQTLATQLGYADGDQQSIYRYIEGLHHDVQRKVISHKFSMRTVGAAPNWEFSSLTATSNLAIAMGTEPIYSQRASTTTTLPLHLRKSHLANPSSSTNSSSSSQSITTSTSSRDINRKRKPSPSIPQEEKKCQYHPNSKTHSTEECRTKGESQRINPSFKVVASNSNPSRPSTRSMNVPTTNKASTSTLSSVKDISQVRCFRCDQLGHYANTCPQSTTTSRPKKVNTIKRNKVRGTKVTFSEGNDDNQPMKKTQVPTSILKSTSSTTDSE